MWKKIKERWSRLVANKKKLIGFIAFWLVLLVAVIVIPIYSWLYSGIAMRGVTSIRGNSMNPTIYDNDILFVQEVQLERGSIVMTRLPDGSDYMNLLKRIVGLPGETVEIKADGVYINGTLLEETYTDATKSLQENNKHNEIVLADNEYFLLGDNREVSYDSRHAGAFPSSSFLYSLTTEANSYTHILMVAWGLVILLNVVLLFALPYLLFVVMTQEPKSKDNKKHQKTKMASKEKSKANKKKKKHKKK